MPDLILDIFRVFIGAASGVAAVTLAWVTIRAATHGHVAYEANRQRAFPSLRKTFKGEMKPAMEHVRDRTRMGLAVRISDGKLIAQERLSSDAIGEVIGRRA